MHGPFTHDDKVAGIQRGEDDPLCIVSRIDVDRRQPTVGGRMLSLENHLGGVVGPRVGCHAATRQIDRYEGHPNDAEIAHVRIVADVLMQGNARQRTMR